MKREDVEELENWLKALKDANTALRKGLGPAHNSNNVFNAIPGIIEYDPYFATDVYYTVVVKQDENGARPIDCYSWVPCNHKPKHDFIGGFGGYYNEDYDTFIKDNPWVENVLDSFDIGIKAVLERKL